MFQCNSVASGMTDEQTEEYLLTQSISCWLCSAQKIYWLVSLTQIQTPFTRRGLGLVLMIYNENRILKLGKMGSVCVCVWESLAHVILITCDWLESCSTNETHCYCTLTTRPRWRHSGVLAQQTFWHVLAGNSQGILLNAALATFHPVLLLCMRLTGTLH